MLSLAPWGECPPGPRGTAGSEGVGVWTRGSGETGRAGPSFSSLERPHDSRAGLGLCPELSGDLSRLALLAWCHQHLTISYLIPTARKEARRALIFHYADEKTGFVPKSHGLRMAESARSQVSRPSVPGASLVPSAKKEGSLEEGAFGEGLATSSWPRMCFGLLRGTGLLFPGGTMRPPAWGQGGREAGLGARPSGWSSPLAPSGLRGAWARTSLLSGWELPPAPGYKLPHAQPAWCWLPGGSACAHQPGGGWWEPGGLPRVAGFAPVARIPPAFQGKQSLLRAVPHSAPRAGSPAPKQEPSLCRRRGSARRRAIAGRRASEAQARSWGGAAPPTSASGAGGRGSGARSVPQTAVPALRSRPPS